MHILLAFCFPPVSLFIAAWILTLKGFVVFFSTGFAKTRMVGSTGGALNC